MRLMGRGTGTGTACRCELVEDITIDTLFCLVLLGCRYEAWYGLGIRMILYVASRYGVVCESSILIGLNCNCSLYLILRIS